MTELKVGDRVRITHYWKYYPKLRGLTGVVVESENYCLIKLDPNQDVGNWSSEHVRSDPHNFTKIDDTPLAVRIENYLLININGNRQAAYKDLYDRGAFSRLRSEEEVVTIVEDFISENPHEFCETGISRFKKAVDFPVREKRMVFSLYLNVDSLVDTEALKNEISNRILSIDSISSVSHPGIAVLN